jgi:cytochrome c-type biogenesis protein CcmE
MIPRNRLFVGSLIIAVISAYMVYAGSKSSWQYYVTVEECLDDLTELKGRPLRVSGTVLPGSLHVRPDRAGGAFSLHNAENQSTSTTLQVHCQCNMPHTLVEGIGVIAEGHLDSQGVLQAHNVLTRCASKYASSPASPDAP